MSTPKIHLVHFRMHLPRGKQHAASSFARCAVTGPLSKPFVAKNGRAGFVAMLPDVYDNTAALVRSHVLATLRDQCGPLHAASIPLPQQRDLLIERLADCMPGSTFEMTHFGVLITTPFSTLAVEQRDNLLTIALPQVSGIAQESLPALRDYAARLAFDAPLCRLEVDANRCRVCVHLPHPPLDLLAETVAQAGHTLLAMARTMPPLAVVVDPEFRPLLELAGSGRWSVVAPQTQEQSS